jgi:hypothetical protein
MKSRKTGILKLLYQKKTGIILTGVIISGDYSITIIIGSRPDSKKIPLFFDLKTFLGLFPRHEGILLM